MEALPKVSTIKLPKSSSSEPETDNQKILREACDNDAKCVCISNAIYKMDSSWCTAGVGKKTNNCGNMRPPRTWTPSVPYTIYNSPGNGQFLHFKTLEDGIKANVELYQRFYAKYDSPSALVQVWSDGNGTEYKRAVGKCFQ